MPKYSELSEKQRKALAKSSTKSHKKNTQMFTFRFSFSTDGAIINFLNSLKNKTDYIRQLIYDDMSRSNKKVIPLFSQCH